MLATTFARLVSAQAANQRRSTMATRLRRPMLAAAKAQHKVRGWLPPSRAAVMDEQGQAESSAWIRGC